jgi:hypothetical protein
MCFFMFGSLGPLFFAEKSVTAMTYLDIILLYLVPHLEDNQPDVVFRQDGAPPQMWARFVGEFLDMHFPEPWVGREGPIPWLPRSLDITPLDSFQ